MTKTDTTQGIAARRAALRMLRAVREGTPFDAALDDALTSLADADRRLAHEIAAGVLRTRTALDGALRPHVTASWDRVAEDVRDILRIGAYQLTELTRVPPYAAVNGAVHLAREAYGARSAGFVNAVLRKVAGTGGHGRAQAHPGGRRQSQAAGLAERYSHPEWLVSRWLARFGEARTEALLTHNNTKPPLAVRPIQWDRERLGAALGAAGITVEAPSDPDVLVLTGAGRVQDLPGFAEGAFIVQDAAQAMVLRHADVPDDALVWDACAAPGGKAASLAARCRVLATDRDRRRVARLAANVARVRSSVGIAVADATQPPLRPDSVDVTLVDAPCSATGTFARHPDARWRLHPDAIPRLAAQQAALLEAASRTVRPGGVLVYITCSLEPEENEEQVKQFLTKHRDFRRDRADLAVFPAEHRGDGAFASRMVRGA